MNNAHVYYYQHSRQRYADRVPPDSDRHVLDELMVCVNFCDHEHPRKEQGEFGIRLIELGASRTSLRVEVFNDAWAPFMLSGVPEIMSKLSHDDPTIEQMMDAFEAAGITDHSDRRRVR